MQRTQVIDERAGAWRDLLMQPEPAVLARDEEARARWTWAAAIKNERGVRAALSLLSLFEAIHGR